MCKRKLPLGSVGSKIRLFKDYNHDYLSHINIKKKKTYVEQ